MRKITLTLTVILYLFSNTGIAQPRFWNWEFGEACGINFSTGSPVAFAGCALFTNEGSASISDNTGQLLFYTDGIYVYDRNNNPMPNGNGTLYGNSSTTESALIFPKPGSTTLYYIFTADAQGGTNGLNYSIVDMTLNGGLGDISTLNSPLLGLCAEKITGVQHSNGVDIWVVCHELNNNTFDSYLLSNAGVAAPVQSSVGVSYINNSGYWGESIGYEKASPNGRKIACAIHNDIDEAQLFDFNNSTGQLCNPITITYNQGDGPYGVSFSPNNTVLYITTEVTGTLYQYDISSNNQATIIASQLILADSTADSYMALQLGPDSKVYCTVSQSSTLACITNPNTLGVGCNFVHNYVSTGSGMVALGLPNFFDAYNTTTSSATAVNWDTTVCTTPVVLDAGAGGTTYLWSTGANTETISVNAAGTYYVTVTTVLPCNTVVQNDTIMVTIIPALTVNLGNDTTLCTGQNITLDAGNAGATYLWSTGAVTETISPTTTGNYKVTVTAGSCSVIDSIMVTFSNGPVLALGNPISVCAGQPVTLDAGNPGAVYLWSNGATTETISPTTSGTYSVSASFGTCVATGSIVVTFIPLPVVNLGPDQLLCDGQTIILDAGNPGATYLWSTGAVTETISVSSTGLYSVLVQNGACAGTDSVQVTAYAGPIVNLGPDIRICFGMDTSLNAGNPGMQYLWNTGDTTQKITIISTGEYWVVVNNHGCVGTDTAIVNVGQELYVSLGSDTFLCPGTTLQINAQTGFVQYFWSPNGGNKHLIDIDQPGTYTVVVTDEFGCTNSASKYVRDYCPTNLFVPNSFSPNGDGLNDLFQAYGTDITSFHIYVFDRWGELLYDSTDIAAGWDGTYNGHNCQQGSYIYRVDYQLYNYLDLQTQTQYGIVNLIR